MLTKNIYEENLSNKFLNAINSISQYIKPKVLIDFLDSRHTFNRNIVTNDAHPTEKPGDLGYYFTPSQLFNGSDRQSYTWGVADALDVNGKVIRSDGNWHAMPPSKSDNYEFGWLSNTKSTSSLHNTYQGFAFTTPIVITTTFTPRKCNNIKVTVPEYSGQIDTYKITVRSSDAGVADPLFEEVARIEDGDYYFNHFLPESLGHLTINRVDIEIYTTKFPLDHARLNGVNILYQEDISDYVVYYSLSKTRDLHESSLPIAGTDSGSLSLELDNTEKDFNIFGANSKFGPLMRKDLKIYVSSGWKIHEGVDQYVFQNLRENLSNVSSTINVFDNTSFPDGGEGNPFVVEINPNQVNREFVLCSGKAGSYALNVLQRGYYDTVPANHSQNSSIRMDTFEYHTYAEMYVDEWSSFSGSMITSVSCADWTKYLSERILTGGFFVEKSTVPEACETLMLSSNFPKASINSLNRYDISARKRGAILHFNFSETGIDRTGNEVRAGEGLRARFFAMPDRSTSRVKDILADAIDRDLSQLEKALGETSFISPDFTFNTTPSSGAYALNLADQDVSVTGFSFTKKDLTTTSEYFNCVFDGFYVPQESGEQYLNIEIANGGVRVFLEDTMILNSWRFNPVSVGQYFTVESSPLYLTAGNQYKIRIESFHGSGNYSIRLNAAYGSSAPEPVIPSQTNTVALLDRIGSRNPSFAIDANDRNKNNTYGIYLNEPRLGLSGGIKSDTDNKHCHLSANAYVRVPNHQSWNLSNTSSTNYINNNWTIETHIKPTAAYSADGEYLSTWSNASPSSGFEFFSNTSLNGFKVITSSGIESVSTSTPLSTAEFNHIVVSSDSDFISYYVNGQLLNKVELAGNVLPWSGHLTFGGRGATYTSGAEVVPSVIRNIFFDQFIMYNSCLTDQDVKDRYTESQMEELTIYPFLYGAEVSIREVIDEISLADLGRFYIDEENVAKYEHYYRLWEPTIDQHANVQLSINDDNFIISADYVVQLQANKVVVKVSGISSNLTGVQGLWRASDPTTLAVVGLSANLSNSATSAFVTSTNDPPFSKAGYLVIGDEIIKYNNKLPNAFLEIERGQFGTDPAAHSTSSRVREVRYWDLKFDKAPAFQVRSPFITGIRFEEPDQIAILRYVSSAYGAELIIAASNNVPVGEVVFAEGTNPLTEKVAFTSIAGIPVLISEQNSQIQEQTAAIEDSILIHGVKEVVIENKFITDFSHAKKIADFIIEKNLLPVPVLNLQTNPTPLLKVGDRIRISQLDAFDIINGEYWVVSKSYTYADSPNQSMTLREVS